MRTERLSQFSVSSLFLGHVIVFLNFKPPSIFLEWMRLRCLNLACGSTTTSPTLRVKKFPPKEAWSGLRDRFRDEATLFKFRKCIDYGECHTNGCDVGHVTAV